MKSTQKLSSLSVFFPVYNEEKNIPLFVQEALDVLPSLAHKFEIIIVNDGSFDASKTVAQKLAKKYKQVRVINHRTNKGYGAALKSGFKAAKHNWIFFTDGDLQFRLNQLKKLVALTAEHDLIIGYRQNRAEGFIRAFNARLFKLYVDILFRLHVRDIDCAFKLLKAEHIKPLQLISDGAFTSSEMLYKLKKQGHTFAEVGVKHRKRKYGSPTGNNIKVVIKAGLEALQLYLNVKLRSLKLDWLIPTRFQLVK